MTPKIIVIHCSATPNGKAVSTEEIRRWHMAEPPTGRGWSDIGYHAVVETDGGLGRGRPEDMQGAHVAGHNDNSLGICFVGTSRFSRLQFSTAKLAIKNWMLSYGITVANIFCHYEFDTAKAQGKTCPNMAIEDIRAWMLGEDSFIEKYLLVEG